MLRREYVNTKRKKKKPISSTLWSPNQHVRSSEWMSEHEHIII